MLELPKAVTSCQCQKDCQEGLRAAWSCLQLPGACQQLQGVSYQELPGLTLRCQELQGVTWSYQELLEPPRLINSCHEFQDPPKAALDYREFVSSCQNLPRSVPGLPWSY